MAPNEQSNRPKVKLAGRHFHLPASRSMRVILGALLLFGGFLGFLPILGFWMIPLGLLILSIDIALVRRHRRKLVVWWGRRRQPRPVADR
ncbi:hypothetical protein FZC33_09670 [Labrys sp. KNU-23]|uniref:hypothetical protein n=1 Tax=Labrys sp. KNU-23 TaxID=2789216 RepID=UPI0011EED5FD|nr:hypothetical protein [Labrys sp. KNU-23]QEN86579.1 hypothetical protein FZC33_09670 [Labrys sp. KNU-23]